MHPESYADPVIAWESPYTGSATINIFVADENPSCGDGLSTFLSLNHFELFSQVIENGDTNGYTKSIQKSISKGDILYFAVNSRANKYCDGTYFNIGISLFPTCAKFKLL